MREAPHKGVFLRSMTPNCGAYLCPLYVHLSLGERSPAEALAKAGG